MTVDTTRVEDLRVRWTPAEVYSIQASGLRDLAEEYAEAGDHDRAHELAQLAAGAEAGLAVTREAVERECAMARCDRTTSETPLVVDVPMLPGPFAVDLCGPCREPFEAGMEAIERLAEGDAEAVPIGARNGREAALEAEP